MCPQHFFALKNESEVVQSPTTKRVGNVLQYKPPVYRENPKGCYIEFRAFGPSRGTVAGGDVER